MSIRVVSEDLYTPRDPHAAARHALVSAYPGLKACEGEPIECLAETVQRPENASWLRAAPMTQPKASPQPQPEAVARPAAPTPTLSAAQLERIERAELACTRGLTAIQRRVILDSRYTKTLADARHVAQFAATQG